jgi:hypothetical protein
MEPEGDAEGREPRRSGVHATPDGILIRLPRLEPGLKDLLLDMVPGRGLMRVLCHPPEEALTHARNARRERLLALRSLIDGLIEETERPAQRGRAHEVPIE